MGWDYDGTDLFIGEEFDGSVGEDTEKCSRVAFEQASGAFIALDIADGGSEASPTARVLGILWV